MVTELLPLVDQWKGIDVLDPCIGRAALPKALAHAGVSGFTLKSCELDSGLANIADACLANTLSGALPVIRGDFLELNNDTLGSWDVAIANPPYIRQEWITRKACYQRLAKERYCALIPGTANLYAL